MVVHRELRDEFPAPHVVSAHTHTILVGFVMMMILGVALWLFPRPPKDDSRYRPAVAEASYWLIATGTVARTTGELIRTPDSALWIRWLIVVASVAQVAALGLFFYTMWPRVRALGSKVREERGERF